MYGQADRATLNGLVKDASGAVVPAATVRLSNPANGLSRDTTSGMDGLFSFPALPIGIYELTITKAGFQDQTVKNIVLGVGQRRTEEVTLSVSGSAQRVDVIDEAQPLDQTTAEVGQTVSSRQLQEIPQNGRNWTSLMSLAPGAINTGEGNQNSIRIFGRSRDDNNWTIDGVDATGVKDPRQEANLRLVVSMENIAEFRVQSTMYTAETGNGAGAQINIVSKSGTNEFHGGVFHYLRNDALDARRPAYGLLANEADPGKLPFRLNQFGGSVGGPLVKNRTFFFSSFEGLRQRLGVIQRGTTPSQSLRDRVLAASPALRPVISLYPTGTPGSNPDIDNLVREGRQRWTENSGSIRIDHRLNDKYSLFGRYNINAGVIDEVRNVFLETRTSDLRTQNAVAGLQAIFKPTLLNEAKFGFNRSPLVRTTNGQFPERVRVPGITDITQNLVEVEEGTSFSVIDNLTWIKGRHTIKAGGELRQIQLNLEISRAVDTRYANIADFIANRADRAEVVEPLPLTEVRRWYTFAYLQDEFKIKSNLTLNAGLRYEFYSVPNDKANSGKVFDITRCAGFCPAGTQWFFADTDNLAPRVSLAWAPKALNNRTVIRIGGGIYYGPGQADDVNGAVDSIQGRFTIQRRDLPTLAFPAAGLLTGTTPNVTLTPRSIQRDRRDQSNSTWTLSIQQRLPLEFTGEVAYVGSVGRNLFTRTFINLSDPVSRLRPLPQFNLVDEKQNFGNSSFNGLSLQLNRTRRAGWLWQAQYMWSKNISDNAGSGDGAQPQNPLCRSCERAVADWDIRHNFTANSVYELPFGRGKRMWNSGFAGSLFGGWEVSGFFTARTGRPFNVTVNRGSADTPYGNTENQRPNLIGNAVPDNQTVDNWLNFSAFALPARGSYGNLGRNAFRAPGIWQLDSALTKRTPIGERASLDFRAEVFNLFNVPQYGVPVNNVVINANGSNGNLPFGRIQGLVNGGATGNGLPRQIQFMLRLNF